MDENNQNVVQEAGSSVGPIIAGIVILAVIIFGALYFMGDREGNRALQDQLNTIDQQSESDATADIEADLNATDVENVDYKLDEENFTSS